jgi:hypothetical protein
MQGTDYQDLDKTPEATATTKTLAANTTHLARQLKGSPYPSVSRPQQKTLPDPVSH